jgi:TM2 domain-containing membrane protein YozV
MTKFCPNCGKELQYENAEICPNCGVRIKEPPKEQSKEQSEIKSSGIAAIASFIVPGLGQIYCGKIGRGIMILIGFIIACILILVVIGIIIAPLLWVWNIYDAYSLANKINKGLIASEPIL